MYRSPRSTDASRSVQVEHSFFGGYTWSFRYVADIASQFALARKIQGERRETWFQRARFQLASAHTYQSNRIEDGLFGRWIWRCQIQYISNHIRGVCCVFVYLYTRAKFIKHQHFLDGMFGYERDCQRASINKMNSKSYQRCLLRFLIALYESEAHQASALSIRHVRIRTRLPTSVDKQTGVLIIFFSKASHRDS